MLVLHKMIKHRFDRVQSKTTSTLREITWGTTKQRILLNLFLIISKTKFAKFCILFEVHFIRQFNIKLVQRKISSYKNFFLSNDVKMHVDVLLVRR